ncbi:MAG TPA: hypothetical protein VHO68_07470 [Bacteroidales bacterium]|nr:hypothetical protein [Bacteroidales bacterium]
MPDNPDTPDAWIRHMKEGNFAEAWKFSDEVLLSGRNRDYRNTPRHFQCIWNGMSLQGKRVLVRCYHGLGDTIQFIRYAPLLKEIASEVILWAQPKLIPLLETAKGIDNIIPLHDGTPEVEYDADVEIMELAHVFRSTVETIPKEVPYLHVKKATLPARGTITAGLVWQSGTWSEDRSVPFSIINKLFELKDITFYILQDRAEEAGWIRGMGNHPGKCTLLEHAEIINSLDLLITADSMPAHLAGALNVPVWVMIPLNADWRWMENRDDCPWYPSMRLFRQEKEGDWEGVVGRIAGELEKQKVKGKR